MKAPLDRLKANGGDWAKLLDDGGDLTDKEAWFKEAFSLFKSLALEHMDLLVQEVLKARNQAVQQMVSNVRIVVATMGAWCKYRAGCVMGHPGEHSRQTQVDPGCD